MTSLEPRTQLRPTAFFAPPEFDSSKPSAPRSLTQAVQSAVRTVDESSLRLVARQDAGLAFQPKPLLALLSYCYAREIYGSADIERVMQQDKSFRELCQNEFPGARVLRRFRRENRTALRDCLIQALRFELPRQRTPADARDTEAQLEEEATRRITMAMFIDSMESEDP